MLKKFSILFIILLSMLFISTSVFATDINMNLPVPNTETQSEDNNITNGLNDVENGNVTGNIQDEENIPQDDIVGDATPSNVSSIAQENMSFSNILNILIITVGVILILLAIAILVRLKS